MNEENKDGMSKSEIEKDVGKRAVEYAQQMAWLISLRRLEYITEDEYEEAHKRLNMKYHQPGRI